MIFWIDDDINTLGPFVDEFNDAGIKLKLFSNVDIFYNTIKKEGVIVDVFIIDLMLPYGDLFDEVQTAQGEVTGSCLISLIRDIPQYEDTPIILLTGINNEEASNKAASLGAHVIHKKKIWPDELVDLVRQYVN